MGQTDSDIQILLERVESLGRKARRRNIVLSIIPVCAAAVLLFVISVRIVQARTELERAREDLHKTELELKKTQDQKVELEKQLRQSADYAQHVYQTNLGFVKLMASADSPAFKLFQNIRAMISRNVNWKPRGSSPEEGFDSPGFAAFMLAQMGVRNVPVPTDSATLRRMFEPTSAPRPGDLVFYDRGFVMFYFEASADQRFCVGMTPVGIVSLKMDFGPALLGYGKVSY